jgi:predicted transposase YdaD
MMQLSPLFLEKLQAAEQQGKVDGRQEGKTEEGQALILRQLKRRVGNISVDIETRIKTLPLPQLEELGEALLDFSSITDLEQWLNQN